MNNNIFFLPETHRDIMSMANGLNGEPMTLDEISAQLSALGFNMEKWQIEEIMEEAEEILEIPDFPIIEYDPQFKKVFTTSFNSVSGRKNDKKLIDQGCKPLYCSSIFVDKPDRESFLDVRIILKDPSGVENLKDLTDSPDEPFPIKLIVSHDYDYVMERRDGLILGTRLNWSSFDEMIEVVESGKDLKSYLAAEYIDMDFISFPHIEILYSSVGPDIKDLEKLKEKQRKRREVAGKAAQIFDEIGKYVITSLNNHNLYSREVFEYYYLGKELAYKACFVNPGKIADSVTSYLHL